MAFNAQDQSTWGMDFGRQLSPEEVSYYAPTMQQNYDRNQAMSSVYSNNGLDGSQWTDIYNPGNAVYGATSATPQGNQGTYNSIQNTGSISAGPSDPSANKNPYLAPTSPQTQNLSASPTENPYAAQFGDITKQLDQYGNQINSVNGALGQYGNQIGNLSNQYGSLSEKVNNFDSTLGQYGSQIGDISKALGQYGTQFGALSSQLNGLQTAQQAQTQAQKDYYAQQTAAQAARQQQYDSSLKNYGDAMTAQTQQGFLQNTMPQLRSGAQAAGQYGGSRQGIAEGVAAGNAATGLATNLASLYSQGYGANVNAGLQQQQLDNSMTLGLGNLGVNAANTQNSYNLGLGNLGVNATQAQNNYNLGLGGLANSNQAQNQNFYTQNRSLDQSGLSLGNQLYNSGVNGQLNLGNAQYNAGNIYQNAPLTTLQNYGNTISPYTGLNSSQVNTGSSGGGATGTLGGILAGLGITKNLGF